MSGKFESILVCGYPHQTFYRNVGEILRYTTAYNIVNKDYFIGFYLRLKHKRVTEKFVTDVYDAGYMPTNTLAHNIFIHNAVDSIVILTYIKTKIKQQVELCDKYIEKLKSHITPNSFIAYFKPESKKLKFEAEIDSLYKKVVKQLNGKIYPISTILTIIKNNKAKTHSFKQNKLSQYYSYY